MFAVRPPEYWPRLAYLALIDAADRFVLADTFQYSRQSFQNRAKLRTPQGWHWISVPLKGGQHGRPVCEVVLEQRTPWARKHWRSLEYNYRSTPFFELYEPDLAPLFARDWRCLAELTCATVRCLHRLFGLSTPLLRASALPGPPGSLPAVVDVLGADDLLAPADTVAHDLAHVGSVQVFDYREPAYRQNFEGFEPGLSALDLLFNYGPEARSILRQGITILDF